MLLNEKDASSLKREATTAQATRSSLFSRPADLVYFIFFLTHIPATLLLDLQAVYPEWLVPKDSPLRSLAAYYVSMTNDPVIGGVAGLFGPEFRHSLLWIISFMHVELLVQLPTFFYGAYYLYHNRKQHILYPLLTFYGASTATTTLPCVLLLLTTPSTGSSVAKILGPTLTDSQRMTLIASYVPYFLIPLWMAVDMAFRSSSLISKGLKEVKGSKWD
ncbi:hypothetical protein BKA70DRAFT_1092793 [Coprinopsis sp. MPI-PUGE-AT-0042]|nr:hypothetical protein BKA70DRAFT_1092793 [Coprinopsis sp. MPI-PUGE-AT-0042]